MTVRDPQEVSDQLENLMRDVEQTEQTVREVEAIFDLAAPELTGVSPLPSAAPTSSPVAGPRTRLRS